MARRYIATRYVAPLREGGSLPAIVDSDPSGRFVVKFRGAGQGPKALIAEIIAANLAVALGLPIPEPAVICIGDGFGLGEPDEEVQDLLRASVGANFGLGYLPTALGFDVASDARLVSADLAADIVWFDALLTNPDRTVRNPNLLVWNDRVWLIDHGASLYFHHRWVGWERRARSEFPLVRDHILLAKAGDLAAAHARLAPLLTESLVRQVVEDIPDEWLRDETFFPDAAVHREAYAQYLLIRLSEPRAWLDKAIDVRRGM